LDKCCSSHKRQMNGGASSVQRSSKLGLVNYMHELQTLTKAAPRTSVSCEVQPSSRYVRTVIHMWLRVAKFPAVPQANTCPYLWLRWCICIRILISVRLSEIALEINEKISRKISLWVLNIFMHEKMEIILHLR
jgi:hypothetical protein